MHLRVPESKQYVREHGDLGVVAESCFVLQGGEEVILLRELGQDVADTYPHMLLRIICSFWIASSEVLGNASQ